MAGATTVDGSTELVSRARPSSPVPTTARPPTAAIPARVCGFIFFELPSAAQAKLESGVEFWFISPGRPGYPGPPEPPVPLSDPGFWLGSPTGPLTGGGVAKVPPRVVWLGPGPLNSPPDPPPPPDWAPPPPPGALPPIFGLIRDCSAGAIAFVAAQVLVWLMVGRPAGPEQVIAARLRGRFGRVVTI